MIIPDVKLAMMKLRVVAMFSSDVLRLVKYGPYPELTLTPLVFTSWSLRDFVWHLKFG